MCFYRCSTDDTAQYTAMAGNIHGQASCQASIIVKSKSVYLLITIHHTSVTQTHQNLLIDTSNAFQPDLSSRGFAPLIAGGRLWTL